MFYRGALFEAQLGEVGVVGYRLANRLYSKYVIQWYWLGNEPYGVVTFIELNSSVCCGSGCDLDRSGNVGALPACGFNVVGRHQVYGTVTRFEA